MKSGKDTNGKTLNLTLWKLDISKAKRQQNEQVSLYESLGARIKDFYHYLMTLLSNHLHFYPCRNK